MHDRVDLHPLDLRRVLAHRVTVALKGGRLRSIDRSAACRSIVTSIMTAPPRIIA